MLVLEEITSSKYYGIFAQSKNCGTRETTFISRQRLGKHVTAATDNHATIEVLLETVFFTRYVQRSYKEDNWGNRVSSVWESVKKRVSWKGAAIQKELESGG
jgi:hypothetical protein